MATGPLANSEGTRSSTVKLNKARNTLEDARALAKAKGGSCLSPVYRNSRSRLEWRCGLGHSPWHASYDNVKRGTWCPTCGHAIHGTIADMKSLAVSRGGQCLSDTFVNFHVPLLWQCANGHEWKAEPNSVIGRARRKGSWCPECAAERMRGKRRPPAPSIDDMQTVAHTRGGNCLSEFYINARTHLYWECSRGHRWWAKPSNVRQGTWCPFCAGTARKSIPDMQQIAAMWGGRCLSEIFKNVHSRLRWICVEGHEFDSLPRNVQRGNWCPHCAQNAPWNLEQVRSLATARGGKCLSSRYVNAHSPLKWQCAKGHEWFARPCAVKAGNWCLRCYREQGSKAGAKNRP